ncbi:ribosomal RNA large subunit methyltransferase I [Striga asiatica]|uniref:Ribosomal RNA large subunit methyltransferase I n=1 Tax=Striga asiatica TaxID=4170 RepID=A0A5A7PUP0_STRAF|nr:ribosomal RNA large subunit methyltransferase I [Striga asiatica]
MEKKFDTSPSSPPLIPITLILKFERGRGEIYQLVHCPDHPPNAGRYTTAQVIARQDQNRNRQVTQVKRQTEPKSVVVEENCVVVLVEDLRRHEVLELVDQRFRNLSDDNFNSIPPKSSKNRLLLRLISKTSQSLAKVLGTPPQNPLELTLNEAKFVSRSSSGDREPTMSALLRSIPTTIVRDLFAGEEAHKTS